MQGTGLFSKLFKLCVLGLCLGMLISLTGCKDNFLGVLNPKGVIAYQERKLLFDAMALMLIVVLPVIIMSFAFVFHYQESHQIRDYKPNWSHSVFLEAIWWGVPIVIIVVLGIVTWKKTHQLDPYNRIPSAPAAEAPLPIQVIALPWKWLFIYPEEKIATVNYLEIPVGRQVEFFLTNDNVPMSAFFIPQLGSQIYTMAGMRTRLHLMANETGVFTGLNSQYNGDGFSDMHFEVHVVSREEMADWLKKMQSSKQALDKKRYEELLYPSIGAKPLFFSGYQPDLFNSVIRIYQQTGAKHPRAQFQQIHHGV